MITPTNKFYNDMRRLHESVRPLRQGALSWRINKAAKETGEALRRLGISMDNGSVVLEGAVISSFDGWATVSSKTYGDLIFAEDSVEEWISKDA